MDQATLTERKSQKDIIYPLLKGVCEIFFNEQSVLLPWWLPGNTRAVSEKGSGICLYQLGEKVTTGPNAFLLFLILPALLGLSRWGGKKGEKRTATCKTCIAQIHIFTKSALQRGRKNMNLYLQVHHLTNASCQKSVPSLKQQECQLLKKLDLQ